MPLFKPKSSFTFVSILTYSTSTQSLSKSYKPCLQNASPESNHISASPPPAPTPSHSVQTCSVSHPTTSSSLHSDLWPSLLLSPHLQVQSPGSRRSVMRSLYSPLFKTLQWFPSMLSTHTKTHPLAYQTKHEPALAHSVQPTDHP